PTAVPSKPPNSDFRITTVCGRPPRHRLLLLSNRCQRPHISAQKGNHRLSTVHCPLSTFHVPLSSPLPPRPRNPSLPAHQIAPRRLDRVVHPQTKRAHRRLIPPPAKPRPLILRIPAPRCPRILALILDQFGDEGLVPRVPRRTLLLEQRQR